MREVTNNYLFLKWVTVLLLSGGFFSCRTETSLAVTKDIKQYHFTISPVSTEQLVAANYGGASLRKTERDSIEQAYQHYVCFKMEVRIDGCSEDITHYVDPGYQMEVSEEELQNYYLSGMQSNLELVEGNTAKPCQIYFYERNFALTGKNTFLIGFERPGKSEDVKLSYTNAYLNTGTLFIDLSKSKILI
ncbi:MAG: hypothetical protein QM534_15845 [Sediminibacterium sp.]|nr:hypothetical protein [Sediminibacterium sp.]